MPRTGHRHPLLASLVGIPKAFGEAYFCLTQLIIFKKNVNCKFANTLIWLLLAIVLCIKKQSRNKFISFSIQKNAVFCVSSSDTFMYTPTSFDFVGDYACLCLAISLVCLE